MLSTPVDSDQDSEFYSWSLSQELSQIVQKEMASFPLVHA